MGRLWNTLKGLFEPMEEARREIIVDAEAGTIAVHTPTQPSQRVHLDEIQSIGIHVTSQGPMLSSLRWTVVTAAGQVWIPFEGDHAEDLLHLFQDLPGFDNEALGKAMARTGSAEYCCWSAAPVPPFTGKPKL